MIECGYDEARARAEKALPSLRPAVTPETDRRPAGRLGRLQAAALLRPGLHGGGDEQAGGDEGRSPLARSETSEGRLREVRRDRTAARSPSRRELAQQRSAQPYDALPELPSETALGARRAYAEAPMGSGDGSGRPARVLRAHRGGLVARRCRRDARAHLQLVGETPSDLAAYALHTLATRLAARGSAGANRLVRMMEAA